MPEGLTPETTKVEDAPEEVKTTTEVEKEEAPKAVETDAPKTEEKPEEEKKVEAKPEEADDDDLDDDDDDDEFSERAYKKKLSKLNRESKNLRIERDKLLQETEDLKAELLSTKNSWDREKNTAAVAEEFSLSELQMEFVTGSTLEEMKASAKKYVDSLPAAPQRNTKLISGSGTAPVSAKNKTKAEILASSKKRR